MKAILLISFLFCCFQQVVANTLEPSVTRKDYFLQTIENDQEPEKAIIILETAIDHGNYEHKGQVVVEYNLSTEPPIVISYPVSYENTTVLTTLKGHAEEKANYGMNVNLYIKGGTWTYDGEKLVRDYSAPSAESINPETPLKSKDEKNYLNSLVKYILIQEGTKKIIEKINKMELMKGDSDDTLTSDLYARLFLFDLFGQYAELMISGFDDNQTLLAPAKIKVIIDIIDHVVLDCSETEISTKKIILFNDQIEKIVLSTEGKKDPVSEMIRRFAKAYVGDASHFDNALGRLKLLKKGLEIVQKNSADLTDESKKQAYMQVWAIDYVIAMHDMNFNKVLNENESGMLDAEAMKIISDAALSSEALEIFVDDMKYMGFYTWGLKVAAESVGQ